MKLGTSVNYAGDFAQSVQQVVELEKAGLDIVWVAEAYSFDAVSQMGYLAAKTERIQIGSGIVNVYSRTAALMAMTLAGLDYVSDGRVIFGLGAVGPQVVEGFHGVPYEKPMTRIQEYIDVCRMVWRREMLEYDGETVKVPLPEGEGTGLGKPLKLINHPVASRHPDLVGALMGRASRPRAEVADGWLPIMFVPEQYQTGVGRPAEGRPAKRSPDLARSRSAPAARWPSASSSSAAGRSGARHGPPGTALYSGAWAPADKNFYNTIARRYGWEAEAIEIQDLYLDGKKDEAAAACPASSWSAPTWSARRATSRSASGRSRRPGSRCSTSASPPVRTRWPPCRSSASWWKTPERSTIGYQMAVRTAAMVLSA